MNSWTKLARGAGMWKWRANIGKRPSCRKAEVLKNIFSFDLYPLHLAIPLILLGMVEPILRCSLTNRMVNGERSYFPL